MPGTRPAEQNQDEVLFDIGPTAVKDLYRITLREDLPAGEFGFVGGNTRSKSTSNVGIIDVYDFGIDRKEDSAPARLSLHPALFEHARSGVPRMDQ